MSDFTIVSPTQSLAAALRAIRSATRFRPRGRNPASGAPRWSDVRHLDEHMLKDIGYAREDRMDAASRATLNRLMATPLHTL